jgi:HD-GYP domain-containing protein (c-di-GMP phosphodiesterase class II)
MVLQELEGKTAERRFSLAEQAKALSAALREEFALPFALFDAACGTLVVEADLKSSDATDLKLQPAAVRELATDGRARILPLTDNRYRLTLLLYTARKPVLLAAGVYHGLGSAPEQTMLQGWVQAVSDRLRLADQLLVRRRREETQNAQSTAAWEGLLAVDQVVRQLRAHKQEARNQQRILESAFNLLPVQSLLWVPSHRDQNVLCKGQSELTPEDCRKLTDLLANHPEFHGAAPLLCNEPSATAWGARFPSIKNMLGFRVGDQEVMGWLLVLNKNGENPFRRSDAALLLPFAALLELHVRWSNRYQDLKELLAGLTRALTTALDAKDNYTFGHSERVARIAVELGRELGLDGEELGDIYLAGLLHDVGKIGIKDSVLHKRDPLTPEEQEHIRQHVTIGYWILAELRPIRNLLPVVLYHHERVDGGGYPDGLAGESIPLHARILAVADAYDAMSHQRPYRDSLPYRQVEEELLRGAGSQWDKQVVEAFMRCRHKIHAIRQRGVGDSLRQAIDGALRSGVQSLRLKSPIPNPESQVV